MRPKGKWRSVSLNRAVSEDGRAVRTIKCVQQTSADARDSVEYWRRQPGVVSVRAVERWVKADGCLVQVWVVVVSETVPNIFEEAAS